MKTSTYLNHIILIAFFIFVLILSCKSPTDQESKSETTASLPETTVPNALPFNMEFVQMYDTTNTVLPRVQSYVSAITTTGEILVVGGRRQGLHTFEPAPAKNFIPDSSNHYIYVLNPTTPQTWSFDVNKLKPELSAPLQSTNQQSYHDRKTDIMYIVGGYGWLPDTSNMVTFNTIIAFNVTKMVAAIKAGQTPGQIQSLIQMSTDDRLAVTGGELFQLEGAFYLVFGQLFNGQYRAFGGTDFTQKYTEVIKKFTLIPNSLKILSYGEISNSDPDRPFHRRDGNIIEDIDPKNGRARIASFGGVFKPGIIAPYTYPVYIYGSNPSIPVVDTSGNQKFSQYECPVISVFDSSSNSTVFHTFFGGIGHYYYKQTPSQAAIYDTATVQGRNDGFPFVEDVTTFLQRADGTYEEWIHTAPVPGNRLLGSSVRFILSPALIDQGYAYSNRVVKLNKIPPGKRFFLGYVYGGIEAKNPLPFIPNTGTKVTNSIFQVYITKTSTAAIPASEGHESTINNANLHRK